MLALIIALLSIWVIFDEDIIKSVKQIYRSKDSVLVQGNIVRKVWQGPIHSPVSRRSVFNPSIIYDHGSERWFVICRYTRGRKTGQVLLQYLAEDDTTLIYDKVHRATMILFVLDKRFNLVSREPVYVDNEPYPGAQPQDLLFWQGEDPRFFVDEHNRLMVQASVHQMDRIIKLAHGRLEKTPDGRFLKWTIEKVIKLPSSQKNWGSLPVTQFNSKLFLTDVYPKWKVQIVDQQGSVKNIIDIDTPGILLKNLRCTSRCCLFKQGTLLTCLHSVHPYQTYFCEIDLSTLGPLRLSPPLIFDIDSYIEFPSGLDIIDDFVYVGVGINDVKASVYRLPVDYVDRLLKVVS